MKNLSMIFITFLNISQEHVKKEKVLRFGLPGQANKREKRYSNAEKYVYDELQETHAHTNRLSTQ